ncbi:DUF5107 domain-containing protein [Echinicola sp. 20G]|uniref:DUF5107 domain-containing protein n=1 Tax=Echinicola sp. 20G TaxID=2781961 RepID=UPI001910FAB8|nr:DUF5107 domain-containing protein [Echinicola sp. 20G]
MEKVVVWVEDKVIPTYEIGEAEKNPIFLEKRVYQGSSGVVYPYPVVEKISDAKTDKVWKAVFMENQYLKIMILPELGGRVQMAYDKIKERHFVYYNHVIKPALVGLTGPWISGGIEFNWPQHHRPSTYLPVEYQIEEKEDGSKTVWCSEVERMFRTKGMAGFTLHPDKAYLEIKGQLYNRTPIPQTFLWWANPAVAVNDHYQSVFPPDVNAVFDHGKRDVSAFPIAKGTYYKVDYSRGVDISKYKNIPVPTSYMAIVSEYDFVGGFENDSKGGLLHVADHQVSPGKKQWTWGNGDFGKAWDRNLTDEDGPYIELMCGVFTDNQPDFSWLMPNEEKSFTQYFMPYQELGVVKNATKDALFNVEFQNGEIRLMVYTTARYDGAVIRVSQHGNILFEERANISPWYVFDKLVQIDLNQEDEFQVDVFDGRNKNLVSWRTSKSKNTEIPQPAKAAKDPEEIESNEQLFLTGQHIEQYRHATFDATAYYLEALKRDPKDYRCNNAMGMVMLKRGKFLDALSFFNQSVATQLERNPNPYDGEPLYNLGLVHRYLGNRKEALDAFSKAVWNASYKDSGYFQLAQLHLENGDLEKAQEAAEQSLARNSRSPKAQHLQTIILRKSGKRDAALKCAEHGLEMDCFNHGLRYEVSLLKNNVSELNKIKDIVGLNVHPYLEYALDYAWAGQFDDAIGLIELGMEAIGSDYPMAYYLKGWFQIKKGESGIEEFGKAALASTDYCFPNRLEELLALEAAVAHGPENAMTYYYLGNFWYHNRQYHNAKEAWEKSVYLNPAFSIANRNLALVCYNKFNERDHAIDLMEKALSNAPNDARILMELDQLYKKENLSIEKRITLLDQFDHLVISRDDLYLERLTLENISGRYGKAFDLIMGRVFHPWEGGEGKVPEQYRIALLGLAKQEILEGNFEKGLEYLASSLKYPNNLGEGKLYGTLEPELYFWMGYTLDKMGQKDDAKKYWNMAREGTIVPSVTWFYNDQKSDKLFYQGLAFKMLENEKEADKRFRQLLEYGKEHQQKQVKVDYFAVSMPDLLIWDGDLQEMNNVHCKYLMGLGHLGLGSKTEAEKLFREILESQANHQDAKNHLDLVKNWELWMDLSVS